MESGRWRAINPGFHFVYPGYGFVMWYVAILLRRMCWKERRTIILIETGYVDGFMGHTLFILIRRNEIAPYVLCTCRMKYRREEYAAREVIQKNLLPGFLG